jgi:hypothetical protein
VVPIFFLTRCVCKIIFKKWELFSKIYCRISDDAENFSQISECSINFLPFNPILEGPIEAQSDIADHGYRTKCEH